MKDWKTSVLGVIGACVIFATGKGYIDIDTATFIGSIVTILFGVASSDGKKGEND